MATQICPHCKKDSFSWSIDDENTQLTYWGCHLCHFGAYENEKENKSFKHKCSVCGKVGQMKLEDDASVYFWCYHCNNSDILKEKTK